MSVVSYKSSSKKRIFQTFPFRRGMNYINMINSEGTCKISVNYDANVSGEEAYPRPSFINALLHNGNYNLRLPHTLLKQATNVGPTFLIGAHFPVSEVVFTSENVGDDATIQDIPLKHPFGLELYSLGSDIIKLNNNDIVEEVEYVSNNDGDTVVFCYPGELYDTERHFTVRLLGIDTPEINVTEPDATSAKDRLTNLLENADRLFIEYDPASEKDDNSTWGINDTPRRYAYIFSSNSQGTEFSLINSRLLIEGLGSFEFASELYEYHDSMQTCETLAKEHAVGIWGTNTDLSWVASHSLELLDSFIPDTSAEGSEPTYFKKALYNAPAIAETIYGTQGFFKNTPSPFVFPATLTEDIIVQVLVQNYENKEYEYTQKAINIPNVDLSWRNAISFLGRVVENGKVRYKGLITLQYGRINKEDELQHFILLQEPHEVNLGAFTNEDPYSIVYNALDDDPYIFRDYINGIDIEANDWLRPQILGVVLYSDANLDSKTKILTKVSPGKPFMVKPYFAIPGISSADFQKVQLRFLINEKPVILADSDEEGWQTLVNASGVYQNINASFYRFWDIQNIKNKIIGVEMKTILEHLETTYTSITDSGGLFNINLSLIEPEKVVTIDDVYTIKITKLSETEAYYGDSVVKHQLQVNITNGTTGVEKQFTFQGNNFVGSASPYALKFKTGEVITLEMDDFKFNITIMDEDDLPQATFTYEVDRLREIWIATGSSPLIIMSKDTESIDPQNLLKEHDVKNATQLAKLDRFLIFYGEYMGNNSLQFSEYDQIDFLPFPYGQITFDAPIVHIHPHMGMLYVFCEDGLWILHGGLNYKELMKTFAYAGTVLSKSEKDTVVSIGNEVFFMSRGKGYVIRANQYLESKEDVYVLPITFPVNALLKNPKHHIQERLQNAYGILTDALENLSVSYYCMTLSNDLYIIASYHASEIDTSLMISYIYNKDTKSWKTYDTISGSFPKFHISSSNIKGFDLICMNHYEDGFPTYASYLYSVPQITGEQEIGDARPIVRTLDGEWKIANSENGIYYPFTPIQTLLDSGALNLNSLHNKRIRKFIFTFSNPEGKVLKYSVIPFIEGIPQNNVVTVESVVGIYGEILDSLIQNVDISKGDISNLIIIKVNEIEGVSLIDSKFTTSSKFDVRMKTNILGKLPGFQLYIPAITRFKLLQYGIQYRQYNAR